MGEEPIKLPDTTLEEFYRLLEEGKLMASKCRRCGKKTFPPRPVCPECYSADLEWVELPKQGRIVTYTIIHVAPPMLQKLAPYAVAVVKLDDGTPIIGMVKGIAEPGQIDVDTRVEVSSEKPEETPDWPERPRIVLKPIREQA